MNECIIIQYGYNVLYLHRLQNEEPPHSPRLFECSNQTGRFLMTEVDDFAQYDLDEEDVMLLDTWEEVRLTQEPSLETVHRVNTLTFDRLDETVLFLISSDFLLGWKICQWVWDQRGLEQRSRIPKDPPSRPWPGHTHYLCQAGTRAAHIYRLVQCMGSS